MRLLLIRHGQTPANVAGILATSHPGPGLTDLGVEQAEALAVALAHEPIAAIHVSTLVRTHLTAAPLAAARGLQPIETPGLHEIEAGALEDRADRASVHAYLGTMRAWGGGDLDEAVPGGFDGHHFFRRFDGAISRIAAEHEARIRGGEDDGAVVVVSHGAAIRVWCGGRGRNIDPDFSGANELDNTGVVVVEGDPARGWRIESWMGAPVGGADLEDPAAADPAGDPL